MSALGDGMLQIKINLIPLLLVFGLIVNISPFMASDLGNQSSIDIIFDERFIEELEIVPGTQILIFKVENNGYTALHSVMLKFEGLPKGVTYKIEPTSQIINSDDNGSYQVIITAAPVVDEGEYKVIAITYTRSETLAEEKLRVVVS